MKKKIFLRVQEHLDVDHMNQAWLQSIKNHQNFTLSNQPINHPPTGAYIHTLNLGDCKNYKLHEVIN